MPTTPAHVEYLKSQLRELDTLYRNAERIHDALLRLYKEHPDVADNVHVSRYVQGYTSSTGMGYTVFKRLGL